MAAEDDEAYQLPSEWQAEHLLLAALVRCSLTSFRYPRLPARRGCRWLRTSDGLNARRDSDGRYAFVEVEGATRARGGAGSGADELGALLAKGGQDCFVAASLTVAPRYAWTVNGVDAAADRASG